MQKIFSSLLLLLVSYCAIAQTRQLTGKVSSDADNSGIVAATVKVKGSSTGTATNAEGVFSLMIPSGRVTLEISSTGFASKEAIVEADQTELNVSLSQSSQQLSEVVVTALGIFKRTKKTGLFSYNRWWRPAQQSQRSERCQFTRWSCCRLKSNKQQRRTWWYCQSTSSWDAQYE